MTLAFGIQQLTEEHRKNKKFKAATWAMKQESTND
jgi:hypothetical protein